VAVQERARELVAAALQVRSYSIVAPARGGDGHLLVQRPAQQCAPERCVHADVAGGHVEFVRPDDAVARTCAVRALELDPCAEEHPPRVRRGLCDDHHAIQAPAQEAHAAVDLTQAALAVGVLGVLGAIALSGGS
jgi:hypothetical protein